MAAADTSPAEASLPLNDGWDAQDDRNMGPSASNGASAGGSPMHGEEHSTAQPESSKNLDYPRGSSVGESVSGGKGDASFRDNQVKVLRSLLVSPSLLSSCHAYATHPFPLAH